MFSHRALKNTDAEEIVKFPESADELFFLFPKADYPLSPEVLVNEAQKRLHPTVVLYEGVLAGYGNFIKAELGEFCSIGNVVVNPELRRKGVASYLVDTLTSIAFKELSAKSVKISCFSSNTYGLLLYHKLGFSPCSMEVRKKPNGEQVALIHMVKYAT